MPRAPRHLAGRGAREKGVTWVRHMQTRLRGACGGPREQGSVRRSEGRGKRWAQLRDRQPAPRVLTGRLLKVAGWATGAAPPGPRGLPRRLRGRRLGRRADGPALCTVSPLQVKKHLQDLSSRISRARHNEL